MAKEFNGITIPQFDLTDKVAIVTGGTKGLGYATAVTLAHFGAKVVVASRTAADCDRVAKELNDAGFTAFACPTDVSKVDQIQNLVDKTVEQFGKLDVIVNNAGSAVTVNAIDMTEDQWDHVLGLDLKAVIFCAQAAAKQMIKQGTGGRIINIASMCGLVGSKAISSYCAAKAGLLNATKALALEWGKYNITINCICPGYFKTDINAYMFDNPGFVKNTAGATALNRFCEMDEITSAIVWLASDHSGYTTGSYVLMDGGTTAK